MSVFVLQFLASDPELSTGIGRREAGLIRLQSRTGCGLFGPYVDLPASQCIARIRFEGLSDGCVIMDICAEDGRLVLASSTTMDLAELKTDTLELPAELPRPLTRCEVRLHCVTEVHARIAAVEIEISPHEHDAVPRRSIARKVLGKFMGQTKFASPSVVVPLALQQRLSRDILNLVTSIPLIDRKKAFLRQVDEFQKKRIHDLASLYRNIGLAKLVLLKVGNLLVLKHGIYHGHTQLVGRPTQIMLDPSNSCQLQCPGCVHNPAVVASDIDWPKGNMPQESFDRIMSGYGPFAFGAIMYNYGEPLINKQFPGMVRRAKSLGLYTWASSNLSLPFDVEGVTASGLDLLTMSIDGISQETLQRYRRRGKYDVCFANMHALVAAKRRFGRGPYLSWQFLTFEHNQHEIGSAIALAKEVGVDELHVLTPFDTSWDDPTVRVYLSERCGRYIFNEDPYLMGPTGTAHIGIDELACDRQLAESWVDKMDSMGLAEEPSRPGRTPCDWLYQNATFDAAGRVMPCCKAPTKKEHLHFANIRDSNEDFTNSQMYRRARLSFVDRAAYDIAVEAEPGHTPYCANCTAMPGVNFPIKLSVGSQLLGLDHGRGFNPSAMAALTV